MQKILSLRLKYTTIESRKVVLCIIVFFIMLGLCYPALRWLTEWRFLVTTNDAYVQGDIATIAPKVSGYIKFMPIKANQMVKKNDVLFYLDDSDYQIALQEAKVRLITQQLTLDRIKAQIAASQTNLDEANALKKGALAVKINADLTLNRAIKLEKNHFLPQSEVDKAQSVSTQANASVTHAEVQFVAAKANIAVLEAQYAEIESQTLLLQLFYDKAQHDLDFTILRAPFDGVIANLSGKKGDFVANGQGLAAIVPIKKLYIDANYKETQIADIYAGEVVRISIDGIKNEHYLGRLLSLAPASSSVFSILPPQNATGNFTKVVRRIPVRISIPSAALETGYIRAGMSVVVSVDTRTKPANTISFSQK
ncbi:MAG: Hemolysin secretion protein D [Candidatus Tokpelaia sp. JSC188]|nr:MAG: Hemolysin secretion protein D [Candidatus Tokpelaia sp. JSC188]